MIKITPDHLARSAFVYVRQSTADQVLNHHESRRRQYALVERARALGWAAVEVIDDDLGRSGSGIARPGFEKLLAAICQGRVGAVVSIEASRLARNGRDWHTLLEFCGLVGTLILDEDGVYDPRHPNDRLLLGMKGTMSEMELSLFRQRSLEALKQKARRGELFLTVAVGYLKVTHDRIEKDPDRRVQEAIALVFAKFAELQTVRQVLLWMRQERLPLPAVCYGPEGRSITWKLPVYNTLHHMLTNPIYAGAYAFGRTGSRVTLEDGRKRIVRGFRKDRSAWEALILDHHEGYIGWAEFERNQRLISDNANGQSFNEPRIGAARRSAPRWPPALRPLRPQAPCRLQRRERQFRALSLPGRPLQSRRRAVHLVRWHADRSGDRRRSDRAPSAARHRGGDRRHGGAPDRAEREAAPDRARTPAGALRSGPCAPPV
jgi:DNA invertase Pin-like site-specific DNA recombinase